MYTFVEQNHNNRYECAKITLRWPICSAILLRRAEKQGPGQVRAAATARMHSSGSERVQTSGHQISAVACQTSGLTETISAASPARNTRTWRNNIGYFDRPSRIMFLQDTFEATASGLKHLLFNKKLINLPPNSRIFSSFSRISITKLSRNSSAVST